jgi:hypothetical protein
MDFVFAFVYLNKRTEISNNISKPYYNDNIKLNRYKCSNHPGSPFVQEYCVITPRIFEAIDSRFQSYPRIRIQNQSLSARSKHNIFPADSDCFNLFPHKSSTFKINPHCMHKPLLPIPQQTLNLFLRSPYEWSLHAAVSSHGTHVSSKKTLKEFFI